MHEHAAVTETTTVNIEVMGVEPVRGTGRLLGLAIVRLEFDGVELTLQGVQVTRAASGLSVQAPQFRHPRDGRWLSAVLLPDELRDAIGREVLNVAEGGG